jgi:predicted permease
LPKHPPAIAERLLRRLLPTREGEMIAGDLREEYQARGGGRMWYWREVLSCAAVRLSPHRLTAPDLRQDLHYAFRVLRRNPGYALTAMVCLGLGIGVNSTVFSMVDQLFWQPLPLPHASRVAVIGRSIDGMTCSYRDYLEFRGRATEAGGKFFSGLAAFSDIPISIDIGGGLSQIVAADAVTANFADVLELRSQLGSWFRPENDRVGSDPVVVIGDGLWTRLFGRSPDAIGQRVRIGTQRYRIIGVAPRGFIGMSPPHTVELWIPVASQSNVRDLLANPGEWERPLVRLVGRLADGRSMREAEAWLRPLDEQIRHDFPRENAPAGEITVAVAAGVSTPEARSTAKIMAALLLSVTGVVLLIACVNVANLILSRSAVRRHEMAVRRALGAGPWRLARQTLAEGVVLAAGGAALGLAFGYWGLLLLARSLQSFPHGVRITLRFDPDWRVMAFVAAAGLASAMLFTLAPAIDTVRVNGGSRRMRQRDVYVVAQVALSLVLLIAATLLLRALGHAMEVDPGFTMDGRLAARLSVYEPEYTADTGRLFLDRVLATVRAMPDVRSATIGSDTPLSFTDSRCAAADANTRPRRVASDIVAAGYFDTLGIPILGGRAFEARDRQGAPPVVIVNQTFARRYWPGRDPVGQSVWLGCDVKKPRTVAQVVGVARDAKYESLDEPPLPFVYTPLAQEWDEYVTLIVHTGGRPEKFTAPLRAALAGLDPDLRVYEIQTLEQYAAGSLWRVRWQATLLAAFGGLAMLLAAVGLYGVVAYTVAQQTRELGIRMAIGAQRSDVLWMVLGRGLRLTAMGIAIGLLLSAAATRLLGGLLYGMSPLDPVSFAAASLAWTAVAMLASYVPARRAMKVDPVVALRWE